MVSTRSKHSVEPEPRQTQSSAATARTKTSQSRVIQPSLGGGYRRSRNGQPGPTPVPEFVAKAIRSGSQKPPGESDDEAVGPRNARRGGSKQLPPVEEGHDERFQSTEADTTTGTQLEAEDLNRELIIETVSELNGVSDKILNALLSGPWDDLQIELRKPGSKFASRMEHYKNNFRSAKKVYGAQEYISPKVVHSVVGTEALDPVLYKANLTVLTLFLFTAQERTEDSMFEDLKNLDRTFPRIFGEKLSQDNFGFALDIRTHALLLCLRSNQDSDGFHAETFIEYFFFEANDGESEASPAPSESRRLRPWDGVNECQGWENDTAQRAAEILEVVGDCKKDKGIDLSSLSEKYPWEDFTDSMVEYVRCIVRNPERQRMFEEAVNKAKDLELFKDPLMEQEYVVNRVKPAKGVKDNKRASKRLPVSQLTGLRQVAAEQSARKTNPLSPQALQQPPPSSAAHDTPLHSKQMPEYTGIDALDVDLPSTIFPSALQYAEKIRRIDREKNKENRAAVDPVAGPSKGKKRSFLDRQDGAERLLWDSQGGDTQLERRGPTEAEKGKSKKRSIPRDDDYDDFEPDTRDENEDRRKRSRKDLPQRNQPQPRSSGVSARRSDIPRNELVPDGVGLPSRHYVSPSVSPEPEDEGAARRQSLIQKMGRIDKKTLAQKAHKLRSGRNPWTDEQSQTLVNMIGRYGTNWRAIVQTNDPNLHQRTNINLKDKARNLKIQFLRNRQALPIGFDKVTIGKKDRQMLFDDYGVDAADYEDKCGQVEGSYYEDEEAAEASVIDEE